MTSNQIAYWRKEEDKRANKAQEAIKASEVDIKSRQLTEEQRHNLEQERIAQVKNDLEARGLDLKQQDQIIKLAEEVAQNGIDFYELPEEIQKKYPDLFGEYKDRDIATMIDFAFKKIGDAWSTLTGGKIGELAKLF